MPPKETAVSEEGEEEEEGVEGCHCPGVGRREKGQRTGDGDDGGGGAGGSRQKEGGGERERRSYWRSWRKRGNLPDCRGRQIRYEERETERERGRDSLGP